MAPDQEHPRGGPRLRLTPPKPVKECWRCVEDRRVLHPYRLTGDLGTFIVQLCGSCLTDLPRDPDPLHVEAA